MKGSIFFVKLDVNWQEAGFCRTQPWFNGSSSDGCFVFSHDPPSVSAVYNTTDDLLALLQRDSLASRFRNRARAFHLALCFKNTPSDACAGAPGGARWLAAARALFASFGALFARRRDLNVVLVVDGAAKAVSPETSCLVAEFLPWNYTFIPGEDPAGAMIDDVGVHKRFQLLDSTSAAFPGVVRAGFGKWGKLRAPPPFFLWEPSNEVEIASVASEYLEGGLSNPEGFRFASNLDPARFWLYAAGSTRAALHAALPPPAGSWARPVLALLPSSGKSPQGSPLRSPQGPPKGPPQRVFLATSGGALALDWTPPTGLTVPSTLPVLPVPSARVVAVVPSSIGLDEALLLLEDASVLAWDVARGRAEPMPSLPLPRGATLLAADRFRGGAGEIVVFALSPSSPSSSPSSSSASPSADDCALGVGAVDATQQWMAPWACLARGGRYEHASVAGNASMALIFASRVEALVLRRMSAVAVAAAADGTLTPLTPLRETTMGGATSAHLGRAAGETVVIETHDAGYCPFSEAHNKEPTPRFCELTPYNSEQILSYSVGSLEAWLAFLRAPAADARPLTACHPTDIFSGCFDQGSAPAVVMDQRGNILVVSESRNPEHLEDDTCGISVLQNSLQADSWSFPIPFL